MSVYVNGVAVAEPPAAHEGTHVDGGADDIDSALALAGIPGFMPKSKLAFTLNKILKGAGAGVEPTEIDVPSAGATLTVAESEVFNGAAPNVWTDLDLSGTIGSQATLVLLKFICAGNQNAAVRKNGDTDEFYGGVTNSKGVALAETHSAYHIVLLVATDATGKIEWITAGVQNTVIDVIAYIK